MTSSSIAERTNISNTVSIHKFFTTSKNENKIVYSGSVEYRYKQKGGNFRHFILSVKAIYAAPVVNRNSA